jgi:4-hydroxy-3-polyprenylbenzoate decarboxylase
VRRLIVAITGASGAVYGVRTLEVLRAVADVETHLVLSDGAVTTLAHELDLEAQDVAALADVVHDDADLAAPIASGSYRTAGMVVAPCSARTVGAVATSQSSTLIVRAADVCLKERRPVVLLVRETPLHLGHLRHMTAVTEMGAVVMPPVPAMYFRPATVADVVDHTVMRALDQVGVDVAISPRWGGLPGPGDHSS